MASSSNLESGPGPFERLLEQVEMERRRLAPILPDVDPADLHSILVGILRPWGLGRRFFIKQVRPGVNFF